MIKSQRTMKFKNPLQIKTSLQENGTLEKLEPIDGIGLEFDG